MSNRIDSPDKNIQRSNDLEEIIKLFESDLNKAEINNSYDDIKDFEVYSYIFYYIKNEIDKRNSLLSKCKNISIYLDIINDLFLKKSLKLVISKELLEAYGDDSLIANETNKTVKKVIKYVKTSRIQKIKFKEIRVIDSFLDNSELYDFSYLKSNKNILNTIRSNKSKSNNLRKRRIVGAGKKALVRLGEYLNKIRNDIWIKERYLLMIFKLVRRNLLSESDAILISQSQLDKSKNEIINKLLKLQFYCENENKYDDYCYLGIPAVNELLKTALNIMQRTALDYPIMKDSSKRRYINLIVLIVRFFMKENSVSFQHSQNKRSEFLYLNQNKKETHLIVDSDAKVLIDIKNLNCFSPDDLILIRDELENIVYKPKVRNKSSIKKNDPNVMIFGSYPKQSISDLIKMEYNKDQTYANNKISEDTKRSTIDNQSALNETLISQEKDKFSYIVDGNVLLTLAKKIQSGDDKDLIFQFLKNEMDLNDQQSELMYSHIVDKKSIDEYIENLKNMIESHKIKQTKQQEKMKAIKDEMMNNKNEYYTVDNIIDFIKEIFKMRVFSDLGQIERDDIKMYVLSEIRRNMIEMEFYKRDCQLINAIQYKDDNFYLFLT